MSSRESVAAYGAGPGVDLYFLASRPWKRVGSFFWHGDADKGWVRLTARKLGMSSRAGVKGCGAGPGVSLYLVVTFLWKGVGSSFWCGVVDEGLVMEQ